MTTATLQRDGIKWSPVATIEKFSPDQVSEAVAHYGLDRRKSFITRKPRLLDPSAEMLRELFEPEVVVKPGNLLTTAGLSRITSLIAGAGGQGASNLAVRTGVGDTNTAAAVGNTDLAASAGSTHRFFQPLDATYPTLSNGLMTFRSTFGTADGNFAWAEWGLDIGTPTVAGGTTVNAVLLNRAVASLGTKVSGAIWVFTTTITLS